VKFTQREKDYLARRSPQRVRKSLQAVMDRPDEHLKFYFKYNAWKKTDSDIARTGVSEVLNFAKKHQRFYD
jgi:hypothetical protein